MINIKKYILDLLFPIKCLGCEKDNNEYLCDECLKNIPYLDSDFQIPYVDKIYSATSYDHPLITKTIKEMKYRFVKDLSIPLSRLVIRYMKNKDINIVDPIIIPVPLSNKRLNWRGFNQAELLAKNIADHFKWTLDDKVLIRKKDIKPQAEIEETKLRKDNIMNAFEATYNIGRNVILIDDVTTSGATLSECAKTLKNKGAKKILAITVAHG